MGWESSEKEREREREMGCEVDPAFIQAVEHRPNPTTIYGGGIPLIDLSPLLDSPIPESPDDVPKSISGLIADVEAACREWGFFQVDFCDHRPIWFSLIIFYAGDEPRRLGVVRHKDSGVLTILFQDDVGGLEVKKKSNGEWVRVNPIPNSYIINVGDIIQVWSNDRYESTEHRVTVNSERERFSIPFFFSPASYTMVRPLEESLLGSIESRYHEFKWGDFFTSRKKSNFKKLEVENIQIYHFKKTAAGASD